ncbi:MAG: type II toxin-antitoxin system VapC family toxin [Candidatus Methylumidiphilus sp.]
MRYLDTSLLVPLHIHEPKSPIVRAWLVGIGAGELAVSEWCMTEFSSAASIKTRTGQIDKDKRELAQAEFMAFIRFRIRRVIRVDTVDFRRAAKLCDQWQMGLRAGDALHLAIAERQGLTVCTLDKLMQESTLALGLPLENI